MSALSAGEPGECSADVSLQTDKTRHHTDYMEKTEPLQVSFVGWWPHRWRSTRITTRPSEMRAPQKKCTFAGTCFGARWLHAVFSEIIFEQSFGCDNLS